MIVGKTAIQFRRPWQFASVYLVSWSWSP